MDKTCLPSCPCSKWRKEDDVDEMQQVPPMESQALISGTLAPDSGKVTYRPRSSIVEDFISVDTCLSKCSQFGRGNLIPGMFVAKKGIIARGNIFYKSFFDIFPSHRSWKK